MLTTRKLYELFQTDDNAVNVAQRVAVSAYRLGINCEVLTNEEIGQRLGVSRKRVKAVFKACKSVFKKHGINLDK